MKNDQFVPSILEVKDPPNIQISEDLLSAQNKTIAQLIEDKYDNFLSDYYNLFNKLEGKNE